MARIKKMSVPVRPPVYVRFSLSERVQHLVMLLSFTTLAITGLVQEFALHPVSIFIIRLWGGVENLRATHHVAATILMLVAIYHLIGLGYKIFVLRQRMKMLPSLQDMRDAWTAFAYNLGLGKSRPQLDRYSFEEKAEYWALVWGILIMGLTGFMMWNPLVTVKFLPGEIIPAAKAAHGAEAVLAVLAIIVWHMYGVHLKRFNRSMWTGRLTETEMLHEHPLELADLKAGVAQRMPEAAVLRKRQRIYYPIAGVLGLAMLFGVYGFVNGEQTAILTTPRQQPTVQVYAPETPTPLPPTPTVMPTPTAAATIAAESGLPGSSTWAQIAPIFAAKCGSCHGASASGGLNLGSYTSAMQGGQDGPVILPGNSTGSKLYQIQSSGGHFGQLSPEELSLVKAWIDAGAPEK